LSHSAFREAGLFRFYVTWCALLVLTVVAATGLHATRCSPPFCGVSRVFDAFVPRSGGRLFLLFLFTSLLFFVSPVAEPDGWSVKPPHRRWLLDPSLLFILFLSFLWQFELGGCFCFLRPSFVVVVTFIEPPCDFLALPPPARLPHRFLVLWLVLPRWF